MERETLDMRVLAGEAVAAEALKAALTDTEAAPTGELRYLYAERLLLHAVNNRDAEAAALVARLMDDELELDARLYRLLNDMLHQQPDTVYAFVRAHVADGAGKPWTSRLKLAALASLRIAITEGAGETIVSWLTLVGREPASYDLGEVFHYGLLAAAERARQDGELGRSLLMLAAKRDPAALDALLDDTALLAALPDNFGRVLRDYEGDAQAFLNNRGPELFLVALARAAQANSGALFTPETVTRVWELYNSPQTVHVQPAYSAEQIVEAWVTRGAQFLTPEALRTALTLMLAGKRDDLAFYLIHQNDSAKALLPFLGEAMESGQRPLNDTLDLIGRIVIAGDMTPQQASALYLTMLDSIGWRRETLPLMQQLTRALHQYPALTISQEALWHLLGAAAESRDEYIARVAVKRLLPELESLEDDGELVEMMRRVCAASQWSETARGSLTGWWRGFLSSQPYSRLQRMDKALEGKRILEDERSILQTMIAVRRMLGHQSLTEFAEQVGTAYAVLEALAEAFDAWAKRAVEFDTDTIRGELDKRGAELSPQQRQILANNLKELAHLVSEMGDNRTRAVLAWRGDELDRALMSGAQPPHSAVDAMKWLSGYWSGAQSETEEEG